MEIEAKYRALTRVKPSDIEQIDWSPYRLGERVLHILTDTVFDDPNRRLSDTQHALRLRNDGLHTYLTFKGPGTVSAGVHQREEIEALIDPAIADDPRQWPPSIRERVTELVGESKLEPIITVHNKRRTWEVWHDDTLVAEIALDRGTIEADTLRQPLHEIELELKGSGTEDDLGRLTKCLQQALPVAEEHQTKFARGLQLLQAAQQKHPPAVPMTPTADLAEAGRAILRDHWRKFLKNEDDARTGDVEAVHDMRVATRRMRAMLEVLTVVYEPKTVARLRKGLRRVAAALGVVRDAEVWIEGIDAYTAGRSPAERDGLKPLVQTLVEQRDTGRRKLIRELESDRTRRLREDVERFLDTPGAGVLPQPIALRVRDRAGSALWARYEELRAFEPVMPVAPIETMHEVRIAGKHLRYTFELFADALPDDTKELRATLVEAQDHLGALHDADLTLAFINTLIGDDPDNQALTTYRDVLSQRIEHERQLSEQSWAALVDPSFASRLAAALVTL